MKTHSILLVLLIGILCSVSGQIPNKGFEQWSNFGNYEDPTYWGSTNYSSSGPFYAITKSTDHYPANVGSYSVRLENDASLNPNYWARGFLASGYPPPSPDFPITGHPTSLTGYYKFDSHGGDNMYIHIQLFKNGSSITSGTFTSATSVSEWTPFEVQISDYESAGSATIIIAAYTANGFNDIPLGNSVLYVDNLNFDNYVTSITETTLPDSPVIIYPNPAANMIMVQTDFEVMGNCRLNIYNISGALVKSEILTKNNQPIQIEDLSSGIYTLEIKSGEISAQQKLVIQR